MVLDPAQKTDVVSRYPEIAAKLGETSDLIVKFGEGILDDKRPVIAHPDPATPAASQGCLVSWLHQEI